MTQCGEVTLLDGYAAGESANPAIATATVQVTVGASRKRPIVVVK